MTYQQSDVYTRAGDWLVSTARRKPEALLLMAAGCALLMRSGRRSPTRSAVARWEMGDEAVWDPQGPPNGPSSQSGRVAGASQYAGDLANKVSDAAKTYTSNVADTVTDYAG
jgi:hypothetical protein